MDAETLRKSAKGKSNSFDKEISKFLDDIDDTAIVDIYNSLFRSYSLPDSNIDENIIYTLGFLWTTTWLNDVPENINSNLKTLSLNLTKMKVNYAKYILDNLNKFARMSTQNYFILKTPIDSVNRKNIVVQGEIYNKWLENGNSPEILIGAWLSNDINIISNVSDEQKRIYSRRYKLDMDIRKQNFETKKQTVIAKELSDYIDDIISEKVLDRSEIRKRFNEIISNKPYKVYNDIQRWVRMVLCKSLYPDSNILNILNSIDNVIKSEPTTPPRDAATVAAVDLILDWFFSALAVEYSGV